MGNKKIKQLSLNPYDSGTLEFKGKSHAKGGIDIQYGGKNVEVEGEETAFKSADGTLHIMGNMRVPYSSNEKFKTVSKGIAKQENKYTKLMEKGAKVLDAPRGDDKFSRMKMVTGELMMKGANMGLKDLTEKKERLAALQNEMLNMASSLGIDAISMSEGKNVKAKYGKSVKADGGASVLTEDDPFVKSIKQKIAHVESGNKGYFVPSYRKKKNGQPMAFGKYQFVESTRKSYYNKYFDKKYKNFEEFDKAFKTSPELQEDVMTAHINEMRRNYGNNEEALLLVHRIGDAGYKKLLRNPQLRNVPLNQWIKNTPDTETVDQYLGKQGKKFGTFKPSSSDFKEMSNLYGVEIPEEDETVSLPSPAKSTLDLKIHKKSENAPDNTDVRYITDPSGKKIPIWQKKMSPLQIAPEVLTLATEKVEPVPGQKFMPDLLDDYRVSFQDRINENMSAMNTIKRGAGEGVLSSLLAETYKANAQIGAEESRVNQEIFNNVYNSNQKIINDAIMQNLKLADVQMERQSRAKSNTKANIRAALNSVASKTLQHDAANFETAVAQSLYGYRPQYDENGKFIGMTNQNNRQFGSGNSAFPADVKVTEKTTTPTGTIQTTTASPVDTQKKEIEMTNKIFQGIGRLFGNLSGRNITLNTD